MNQFYFSHLFRSRLKTVVYVTLGIVFTEDLHEPLHQDIISTSIYELCNWNWKLNCLQLNSVQNNTSDLEKKNKVITEGWRQKRNSIGIWSPKYQIQYSSMYMSWILWTLRQVKILNQRINFGNMLRQHLIKIRITNNQHPVLRWQFINQWNKVIYERNKRTRHTVHYCQ